MPFPAACFLPSEVVLGWRTALSLHLLSAEGHLVSLAPLPPLAHSFEIFSRWVAAESLSPILVSTAVSRFVCSQDVLCQPAAPNATASASWQRPRTLGPPPATDLSLERLLLPSDQWLQLKVLSAACFSWCLETDVLVGGVKAAEAAAAVPAVLCPVGVAGVGG